MTTSIVFGDIDYSEIEFDIDSTDDSMLTDPSASIIALQNLRILKTRETGEVQVIPNTAGRTQTTMIDFTQNNSSYEDQKMRRKVEVLKYKKHVNETKKTQFSALASRRGKYSKSAAIQSTCSENVERRKVASKSGIKCDRTILVFNPNVQYIDKL
tara:strand:- start:375 stop:842 length:468 start_codon:yes stop_codon:yes gene_type:complete